jgi:molecular chaperone DnaK
VSADRPKTPTLAECLARTSGREFERRLHTARYYAGIDLGTTNSSVTLVDALALLRGDADEAVRVLPLRQHTSRGVVESPYLPSVVAEVEPGEWWVGLGARDARSRGLLKGRQIFYSTKLEMGLGREPFYPQAASPEYDSPYKVAGRILQEIREALEEEVGEEALSKVVVTVPASFQLAARKDTFRAARLAGLELQEQALLDEPNAAFLDYVLTGRSRTNGSAHLDLSRPQNVLVVDFGGGTCDVSVLRVHADGDEQRLKLSNLAIARYEQLGGDNIDAAIVERVLLPQLLEQNGLESLDLTFTEKKERILPQLLRVAEAVKLRLCTSEEPPEVPRSIPIDLPPRAGSPLKTLTLHEPSLTRTQLEEVLEPFVDRDFLYPRDSELTPVMSVFGPVGNALENARLDEGDVDALLLVGGSTLIPQVRKALTDHFPQAALLRYENDDRTLCAVTRGAALQSFFVHAFGRPLVNPIAQESLGVLTQQGGYVELIPQGTELPYPGNGEPARYRGLVVPRDLMKDVQIVVAAGGPEKPLGIEHLKVPLVQCGGEPIDLTVRLDTNKILTVRAELASHPEAHCMVLLENPLCAVAYGSQRQKEIAELEDELARKTPAQNPAHDIDRRERLALLYQEERKYERAIDEARKAMEAERRPSLNALNLMAISYNALGASDRAEKHYREAIRVAPASGAPRFNLSLLLERQGRIDEAERLAGEAVDRFPRDGVYRGWRAILWKKQARDAEAKDELRRAAEDLDALPSLDRWERYWRTRIAEELGDKATVARLEREANKPESAAPAYDESCLPGHTGTLARRAS